MKLVFANSSYSSHTTDEGAQLQQGLWHHGWDLAGYGYDDDCTDTGKLLERWNPQIVFLQDRRDWDKHNPGGSFGNQKLHFDNIDRLKSHPSFKVTVCKDAGNHNPRMVEFQRQTAEEIGAGAIVTYYHDKAILGPSPWLADYTRVRTYHSVDAALCASIFSENNVTNGRRRGIVTGALNRQVYPLRAIAFDHAAELGLDVHRHPGYSARGCQTPDYLRLLSRYHVHVATASRYGFALRKLIESVAMGCTPITDLPAWDALPEIDEALVRVPPGSGVRALEEAIRDAERTWNLERALHFAKKARERYDFRYQGKLLDEQITRIANREDSPGRGRSAGVGTPAAGGAGR